MADTLPASITDQYQISKAIGEGPYASVYEATDVDGEAVAVKVFDARVRRDPTFTAHFRRDAQSLQSMNHPRLLPIQAYGVDRGSYYVVMPVASGEHVTVGPERLAPAAVARIGADVSGVLDMLHRHGYTHGAVKPSNLFHSDADGVTVTPSGGRNRVSDTVLPESDCGIVSYLSPEQIIGRAATPATDIYSLGIVLYQACTGTLPFRGANAAEVAGRAMEGAPEPPRSRHSAVPLELNRIILRCLAFEPSNRYGSAMELAEALEACATVSLPLPEERAEGSARSRG